MAIETAKIAVIDFLIAGRDGVPPVTVRAARDGLIAVQYHLLACREAEQSLSLALAAAEQAQHSFSSRIREAAITVCGASDEAHQLIQHVEQLQNELADVGGALLALVRCGAVPGRIQDAGLTGRLNQISQEGSANYGPAGSLPVRRMQQSPASWGVPSPTANRWTQAIEALLTDAEAPLNL